MIMIKYVLQYVSRSVRFSASLLKDVLLLFNDNDNDSVIFSFFY